MGYPFKSASQSTMPMQRFRSNSTSSVLESPLSLTYSPYTRRSNDRPFSGTRCEPINVPVSPSTPTRPHFDRISQDFAPISSGSRLSLSPIGNAAGVMKKLLRRRRGNTNSSDGGGGGFPSPMTAVPSFIIVGGHGGMAAGATVYDLEPFQTPSSPSSCHSPVMNAALYSPHSPASPTSPKSPHYSQSMFTRITGRDNHYRQPPFHISEPIMTSTPRGCSLLASLADGPRSTGLNMCLNMNGPLALSSTSTHKKMNRRSLSADNLMTATASRARAAQRPSLGPGIGSDGFICTTACKRKQSSLESLLVGDKGEHGACAGSVGGHRTPQQLQLRQQQGPQQCQVGGIQETEQEFYKNSVEFLNTHHSRNNMTDNWANRNKRKPSIPVRRQSESSLLNKIIDATNEVVAGSTIKTTTVVDHDAPPMPLLSLEQEDVDDDYEPSPFGPDSCWKDFSQSRSSTFDSEIDPEYRSLLSSVDIMLVSSISSPTQYYDNPKSRKLIRAFLTSGEREFDEAVEFGFPTVGVIDDKDGRTKDCRFLTLRLTLTPWHARADELRLYGLEKQSNNMPPLKDMVNKFLTKTSAMLSSSPPRTLGLAAADAKQLPLSAKGRRSSAMSDMVRRSAPSSSSFLLKGVHSSANAVEMSQSSTLSEGLQQKQLVSPAPVERGDNSTTTNITPPKNMIKNTNRAGPRSEKGFRITDPSSSCSSLISPLMTSPSTTTTTAARGVRSAESLSKDPELHTSPPTTPSPTALHHHDYLYPSHQQLQPPRKCSLSALSLPMNTCHNTTTTCSPEENMLAPPVVPPRRKASSPAIFSDDTTNGPHNHHHQQQQQQQHQLMTLPRPKTTAPLPPFTIATLSPFSSPSPLPSPSPSQSAFSLSWITDTSSPIPIPGARGRQHPRQQQQHQQVDSDICGAPVARTPRAPVKKTDLPDDYNNCIQNSMTTTTTTPATVQEYARHHYHYQHQQQLPLRQSSNMATLDTHKMYIPRTQYTVPCQ
ncbi:hypothetical protein EDD21DRAFT_403457 [Dissophora ornata]|nr:hypothetical protein EDD21DRAFT_403457 [Dissophora ornata]